MSASKFSPYQMVSEAAKLSVMYEENAKQSYRIAVQLHNLGHKELAESFLIQSIAEKNQSIKCEQDAAFIARLFAL